MDYQTMPNRETIERVMAALAPRGVSAEFVATKAAALNRLQALIPPGASVQTGGSMTLRQIGFEDLLKSGKHPWRNLKAAILAEKDPAKQSALRRAAATAECFVASVHAIAESGEIVIASATGSQLASYAYASPHVIWVAGAQKIVPDLAAAMRRVREFSLPMEDQRQREESGGQAGSFIGKILIFEREAPYLRRQLTLLLINEVVGY